MTLAGDCERFLVELLALPDTGASRSCVPPVVRLRKFLKAALRAYGLRCTRARSLGSPGSAPVDQALDVAPTPRTGP
jgi:hypothetical protein